MSRIERNLEYDDRLLLLALRSLSRESFDPEGYRCLFEECLIRRNKYQPLFSIKEFCFKFGKSILLNKKIEITRKDQIRISNEDLAHLSSNILLQTMEEIKQRDGKGYSVLHPFLDENRIVRNYGFNLSLLKELKSECEICGSVHQFGDLEHFNRFYLAPKYRFMCLCPTCLEIIVPNFHSCLKLSDEDVIVLTGLEIIDEDQELEKFLVDTTPRNYRCLASLQMQMYSNVFTIWDLCQYLGSAYDQNKKVEAKCFYEMGVVDGSYTQINLR